MQVQFEGTAVLIDDDEEKFGLRLEMADIARSAVRHHYGGPFGTIIKMAAIEVMDDMTAGERNDVVKNIASELGDKSRRFIQALAAEIDRHNAQ